jgi:sucrose phosphorylase
MLGCDDDAYLAARAIQFFTPGVPQVYYVGLLAGENDVENINKTGDGREINRHNFSIAEVEASLQKDVVQRLLKLIRFRNTYPAFHGEFTVLESGEQALSMQWKLDEYCCRLDLELATNRSVITSTDAGGNRIEYVV